MICYDLFYRAAQQGKIKKHYNHIVLFLAVQYTR
jgi:hypothetical protein